MIRTIAVFLIIGLIVVTGWSCFKISTSNSPGTTSSPAAQETIAKTRSAITQVNSYKLDTDVVNTYKYNTDSNATTSITEWKGTKLVNISNREMGMNMKIKGGYSGSNINADLEMYFKDGYEYLKTLAAGLSKVNPWDKTPLTDTLWSCEIQIPYLTEILETTTQSNIMENERVNEIDCFVLGVTPTTQAIIDWVVSQEQPFGPQVDMMHGGGIPVVRADAFQNGSVKLWIDKDSYLPIQVEINADFQGNVGGGMIPDSSTPYTPTTNPVDSSFQGRMNFSNYNQPVSIQVPREALNAIER